VSTGLFDDTYRRRKAELLPQLLALLAPQYTVEELAALRIDPVNPAVLAQRSGRGFVNRDILETVLGNLLECVAPGSHNIDPLDRRRSLEDTIGEMADQVYAMVAQSLLAVDDNTDLDRAMGATFSLLADLPQLKLRAWWNRFASLKDPAVWDAYLRHACDVDDSNLMELEFATEIDKAISLRDPEPYREYLRRFPCKSVFDYQMQLVASTYPGWRVLFYHDIAHGLTQSVPVPGIEGLTRLPVPLIPRAIAELGGRYYQASASRSDDGADGHHRFRMPHPAVHTRRPDPPASTATPENW
jgi:hypothetical protein